MHREIGRVSAKPNLLDHKLGPGSTTPENRSNLDRFRHYEKQRDHQHHRHLLLALFCFGLFHHGLLQPISGCDSFLFGHPNLERPTGNLRRNHKTKRRWIDKRFKVY